MVDAAGAHEAFHPSLQLLLEWHIAITHEAGQRHGQEAGRPLLRLLDGVKRRVEPVVVRGPLGLEAEQGPDEGEGGLGRSMSWAGRRSPTRSVARMRPRRRSPSGSAHVCSVRPCCPIQSTNPSRSGVRLGPIGWRVADKSHGQSARLPARVNGCVHAPLITIRPGGPPVVRPQSAGVACSAPHVLAVQSFRTAGMASEVDVRPSNGRAAAGRGITLRTARGCGS